MVLEPGGTQPLLLQGEVVEIVEKDGNRFARVVVEPRNVVDITAGSLKDAHLGDQILIEALITIQSVTQTPEGVTDK